MIEYMIPKNKHISKNKRDFVADIEKFISGDAYLDGSIIVIYGTQAVKPAKYEYRPVYDTFYHMVVGFMTAEQIKRKLQMPCIEKYDKVLVAVPGTDIQDLDFLMNQL